MYRSIHGTEYGAPHPASMVCACLYPPSLWPVLSPPSVNSSPLLFSFSSLLESFCHIIIHLYHHHHHHHHSISSLLRTQQLMPPPNSHQSNHPIHLGAQPIHLVDHICQFNHIPTGLFRCRSACFGLSSRLSFSPGCPTRVGP